MNAKDIQGRLRSLGDPVVAAQSARFFKSGPGEYGEGDVFIGVRVPMLRRLAKEFRNLPDDETVKLLRSEIHEARVLALLILVLSVDKSAGTRPKEAYDLYLANTAWINNWDLVDCSAPQVVGGYLHDRSRKPLYKLAKSNSLWERRISVLATLHFIRYYDFKDTLQIAKLLLDDRHDLIHKAVGWMLRETGKKNEPTLERFLEEHAAQMPRTMLRYAIERLPERRKREFMAARIPQ
jgi:3-methyladenine DNA glycosylase AlkD